MAEEKAKDAAPKKSFKLNIKPVYVIIGGLVLMSFITFLTGYFATHKSEKPVEKPKEVPAAQEEESSLGLLYPLETFVVNLIDYNGRRYLKATIELEIEEDKTGPKKEAKKEEGGHGKGGSANPELDKMVPYMRNIIINILSSKTFKDISSVEGKDSLRQEIAFRINGAMTKGKIKNVYFKEFVVQ